MTPLEGPDGEHMASCGRIIDRGGRMTERERGKAVRDIKRAQLA